jgi:hypothetical protein
MRYLLLFLLSTQFLYAEPEYKVVIFGSNYSLEDSAAFLTDKKLEKLFTSIKSKQPNAVFFTGNLVMGLENSKSYNADQFKKNLVDFSKIKDAYLGKDIPFFPTLGNHQQASFDMIEIFREHFNIQKISPRPPYHLAYTVPVDAADFIVLATGYEEPANGSKSEPASLEWLEKYLNEDKQYYKYRFVLGHFPAFSSTATTGDYSGLDKNPATRDMFWSILRKNRINAYFSSYEPLYDRSNREGIWQVISGGNVSEAFGAHGNKTFSHYLLLIWGGENDYPILKVVDLDGKEWDSFKVTPLNFPVHQMRISDQLIQKNGVNP